MADHNEIGKKGEAMAQAYLKKKGYNILATNYRFKQNEIDIVTEFQDKLVVVEVKTRQSSYLAGPEDTVSKKKQRAIIKCTNAFIDEHDIDLETQFDISAVILNEKEKSLEHLEDAFYPLL